MKTKFLALFMLLVLALTACSSADKKQGKELTVVGNWTATWDVANTTREMLGDDVDFNAQLLAPIYLDLKEDGTYLIRIDKDELMKGTDDFIANLIDVLVEQTYKTAEAGGTSREEYDQQVKDNLGMSIEEYIEQNIDSEELFGDLFEDEIFDGESGSYTYKDGKLYLAKSVDEFYDDHYLEVTLEDNTLTVTAASGSETIEGGMLPLTFTKGTSE